MKSAFNRAVLVPLFIAVGLSAACKQDPLADKTEEVQNSQPPSTKPTPTPPLPISQEALRIDAPDYASFKEGLTTELKVSGRVLQPIEGQDPVMGTHFEVTVDNLEDFPEATFDAATGSFKWTPPLHFVTGESTRNMRLELTIATKLGPKLAYSRAIPAFVTRAESDPEVVEIKGLEDGFIREGETRKFTVTVKDPDAMDADKMRPRLMAISACGSCSDGGQLMKSEDSWQTEPKVDPADPSLWTFEMKIDTEDRELSTSETSYTLNLVTVSRFGRSSAPKDARFKVRTRIREPQISWNNQSVEMVAGIENMTSFSVYDPLKEGQLAVNIARCDLKLPGANCSCTNQANDSSQQLCTIRWKIPSNFKLDTYSITAEYFNKSRVSGDGEVKQGSFTRNIRVVAPGQTAGAK
jgi:hypothetical protein